MRTRVPSPTFVGTLAGAGTGLLLVLSEYRRILGLIDTSSPVGRADLRDQTVAALLAFGPSVLSSLLAADVLIRIRSVGIRLALSLPLSVVLGTLGFIPTYYFSYIDVPPEHVSHIWVAIPPQYASASILSALVAVAISSAVLRQRRRTSGTTPQSLPEA